ncbi:hypothetical protein [Spirosoma sp. 209]|uniref:hypothetical protein n=1 Tax=Spirosoma sp. 209 TaxID=1955701 RepID=UPI00098D367E|nr:hypothetical protein [Spirosoma sp. 209]
MNFVKRIVLSCLLVLCLLSSLLAQRPFLEGVISYKADTITQAEPGGPPLFPTQTIVYKKGNAVRIEIWRVNKFDSTDIMKDIYIRNDKGAYLYTESTKPINRILDSIALFMTHEEEKQLLAEQALQGMEFYTVDRVLQKTTWLNLPAEKVALKGGSNQTSPEAVITRAIDIPLGTLFNSVSKLPGTPLQFMLDERGWKIQLTATSLTAKALSDTLFRLDAKRKPMSMSQMGGELSDFK